MVTTFTRESAPSIFDSPIKKQVMLFTTSNDTEKFFPVFQDAARYFKGKLIFVYIKIDDEDVGRPVANYFGVEGDTAKIIGYSGLEDPKKYIFDGEITVEKIKIAVDSARTVVAFYKFIKKHAAIPFKLQKPSTSTSTEKTEVKEDIKSSSGKVKDEL
nr:protein disulfide isomerase-like 1-4 [Ipomoea batatas]